MPAKSKAQQRFMGMCAHNPKHARGKCPSPKVAREFASGKTSSLPKKIGKKKKKMKAKR